MATRLISSLLELFSAAVRLCSLYCAFAFMSGDLPSPLALVPRSFTFGEIEVGALIHLAFINPSFDNIGLWAIFFVPVSYAYGVIIYMAVGLGIGQFVDDIRERICPPAIATRTSQ